MMLNYIFSLVVVNAIQTYNQGKTYRSIYIYRYISHVELFNLVEVNIILTYDQGKTYRSIDIYRHISYTVVKLSQQLIQHKRTTAIYSLMY